MAYVNANPATEEVTRIYCDSCSHRHVTFTLDKSGVEWQNKPWRWFPRYGDQCHACGEDC